MECRYLGLPIECSSKNCNAMQKLPEIVYKIKHDFPTEEDMTMLERTYLGLPVDCSVNSENRALKEDSYQSEDEMSTDEMFTDFLESVYNNIVDEDPSIKRLTNQIMNEKKQHDTKSNPRSTKRKRRNINKLSVRITRSYNRRVLRNRSYLLPVYM